MRSRKIEPRRYCRHCAARLRRKVYAGRLEDFGVFSRRIYCDRLCMAQGMLKADVSREQHYHRARKHRKEKCERCPSRTKLHVHHKDEDFRNDDPSNLETLCERCHGKEHGPKRGNTFAGRQWLLKSDLGEIWVACRDAMRAARKAGGGALAGRLERILHKQGQL